jgi:steroid delta-isomerase-like uncharacterized protein
MLRQILRALPAVVAIAILSGIAYAGEVEEKNKAVARTAVEEVLGRGKVELYDSLYWTDYVSHNGPRDAGREADRRATQGWHQAFPDLKITIDKVIAEGDLVAVRFVAEGTNTGSGNGLTATGKRVRIAGMTILRIVDGKIAEEWASFDQLDFLRQLGLMPASLK